MKSINHERYDPMVFWVDSIGKLRNIPFIDHQEVTMIISTDFPVNIWVVSFMDYAFHGSTFFQSGVYYTLHNNKIKHEKWKNLNFIFF